MKTILFASLLINSLFAFGGELKGNWSRCEIDTDGTSNEHTVLFDKNNVEFETSAIYGKGKLPCLENPQIIIGRFWHYEASGGRIQSTLFSTFIILSSSQLVKEFNEKKVCGHTDWRLEKRFDCEYDGQGYFTESRGYKTKVDYNIDNNELQVTTKKGTLSYIKLNHVTNSVAP